MTDKHSPTPFNWVKDCFHGGYSGIEDANGETVLAPNCCNDGDEGAAWFEDFPSERDRKFIKRACDSHDELVEALKMVLAGEVIDAGSWDRPPIHFARAAIAKATGKDGD